MEIPILQEFRESLDRGDIHGAYETFMSNSDEIVRHGKPEDFLDFIYVATQEKHPDYAFPVYKALQESEREDKEELLERCQNDPAFANFLGNLLLGSMDKKILEDFLGGL